MIQRSKREQTLLNIRARRRLMIIGNMKPEQMVVYLNDDEYESIRDSNGIVPELYAGVIIRRELKRKPMNKK